MTTPTREHIERTLRQALYTFPGNPRHRTCYLVAYLVAVFGLDVTLANRFLGPQISDQDLRDTRAALDQNHNETR